MTCKDCFYYGDCIMSAPDGNWIACDEFVENEHYEHCEYVQCIIENIPDNLEIIIINDEVK